MPSPEQHGERLTALFFLGVILFNPIMLSVFDAGAGTAVLGVPVFYLYLFAAWAGLIALLAVAARRLNPDDAPSSEAVPDAAERTRMER